MLVATKTLARCITSEFPAPFGVRQWLDEPRLPLGWPGLQEPLVAFLDLFGAVDDDHLSVLGHVVPVYNLQITTPEQGPNYPLYFELLGSLNYVVSIWSDRICIEYQYTEKELPSDESRCIRTSHPVTVAQLRADLVAILSDCVRQST